MLYLQILKPLHFFYSGGLNLNATGYARMAEVTARDASIAVTLAAHQAIGLKVVWSLFLINHGFKVCNYRQHPGQSKLQDSQLRTNYWAVQGN